LRVAVGSAAEAMEVIRVNIERVRVARVEGALRNTVSRSDAKECDRHKRCIRPERKNGGCEQAEESAPRAHALVSSLTARLRQRVVGPK
jgi:hypothetical protein